MLFITTCLHECYIFAHMTMHFGYKTVTSISNMLQFNTNLRKKKLLHDYINLIEYDKTHNMAEKDVRQGFNPWTRLLKVVV